MHIIITFEMGNLGEKSSTRNLGSTLRAAWFFQKKADSDI
ncbi:hypothetical protein SLEP1_g43386 [Rubroshorea leprosula]|uniref:Uncharacterized protein n=1 Tax=Rubroshorea leprosula TaxID=152421 RepID=A0AAV5LD46_9ROSI|nr:hypothetical protein SLEP1_g43386 [Rubroshorea leprosula]